MSAGLAHREELERARVGVHDLVVETKPFLRVPRVPDGLGGEVARFERLKLGEALAASLVTRDSRGGPAKESCGDRRQDDEPTRLPRPIVDLVFGPAPQTSLL